MVKNLQLDATGIIPEITQTARAASCKFSELGEPAFLSASFALRYEVYCKERRFLTPEKYPQKCESDHYDNHAVHVGGTNSNGEMVGTVRMVLHSALGFPMFEHCKIFPQYEYLTDLHVQKATAEISRLAFTKHHRTFPKPEVRSNGEVSCEDISSTVESATVNPTATKQDKADITLGIYKTIYQISKRRGITHWCAAMEKSLLRLMGRFHFAFTPIGPELDYYGPVTPYVVTLAEIEKGLRQHCPATYADFINGLEPELVPVFT
ncbi:MAG: PEP-CTERM/exosortase system-associated acyltransferase [Pseudomonadota bacterium]